MWLHKRAVDETWGDDQLPRLKKRARRSLPGLYYCLASLCAVTVVIVLFSMLFRPCEVQGNSMNPTLHNGDRLLLFNWDYEPAVGDIVAIRREEGSPLIKRVIALGGDRLFIDPASGAVYRNGRLLDEPYLTSRTAPIHLAGEITVPEGMLFVMGDNRAHSRDSRYADVGPIAVDQVIGKAVWRFYPFADLGGV